MCFEMRARREDVGTSTCLWLTLLHLSQTIRAQTATAIRKPRNDCRSSKKGKLAEWQRHQEAKKQPCSHSQELELGERKMAVPLLQTSGPQ